MTDAEVVRAQRLLSLGLPVMARYGADYSIIVRIVGLSKGVAKLEFGKGSRDRMTVTNKMLRLEP